jgi:hypothetical protein
MSPARNTRRIATISPVAFAPLLLVVLVVDMRLDDVVHTSIRGSTASASVSVIVSTDPYGRTVGKRGANDVLEEGFARGGSSHAHRA